MTTISEVAPMKIYTENRILCPICNKNSNFIFVIKQVESTYYLLEMCPKCNRHAEDVREISSKLLKDYPAPQK